MKKVPLIILLLSALLLSSCDDAKPTAKHTYSELGYSVSYNYPEGYYAV